MAASSAAVSGVGVSGWQAASTYGVIRVEGRRGGLGWQAGQMQHTEKVAALLVPPCWQSLSPIPKKLDESTPTKAIALSAPAC